MGEACTIAGGPLAAFTPLAGEGTIWVFPCMTGRNGEGLYCGWN